MSYPPQRRLSKRTIIERNPEDGGKTNLLNKLLAELARRPELLHLQRREREMKHRSRQTLGSPDVMSRVLKIIN